MYLLSAALLDSPQMLIAEEEKIIIEETSGNQTIVEEKYVFIYSTHATLELM
jgi:hypothetical protein